MPLVNCITCMKAFGLQIVPRMIWAAIARGRSRLGFGSSSAICVTASGVPIVKAPFRTPVKNATPPDQPVEFSKSVQTKEVLACWEGIAAITTMVTKPPTTTMKSPKLCSAGKRRFPKMVTAIVSQQTKMRATKMCHGAMSRSGW